MCLVSIIIPVYNGEKYIGKCLKSVINQSLNDIQIICVNDGSTDNTISILNHFASKDNRIKILSTENRGQGSARNIGLKHATGEYISFFDADDWINENALELLYNKAKSEDLEMLFFQMVNYIENSKKYIETDLYNHTCFEKNSINENNIFSYKDTEEFLFEIPVCPVSKFYKKEFLDSNFLQFPEGMFFEDNAFFYNSYFKCGRAGFLKKHLYYRRRHEDSVTQRFDQSKFDIVKATNKVLDIFLENDQYSFYKEQVINHTFSMILEWFNKSPLNLKEEFFNIIKRDFKGFNELKDDFNHNLKEEYLLIFNIMNNHDHYLDFLTIFKLSNADYEIYDNGNYYPLKSNKYEEYKKRIKVKKIKETNSSEFMEYKISVVIPIFNNETLIHRTLMSIENQTFGIENIEVLMVNDASTDNTKVIINDYADKYDGFKAIHISEGTGSAGTPRNIGLLEASSEYVIFLDHDDYFETDALEKLYDSIVNCDCDLIYGTYASVDEGLCTKIVYPNEYHGYFNILEDNPRCISFPPPSIWTKLFKRKFLIENSILFPSILGEDAIFISKALFKARGINYLWDNLICYHDLNHQSSTNNVSFNYLLEGLVSEEYMYNLYNDYESFDNNEINLYKIRAEGILDFYLNQFYRAELTRKQIFSIFPLLYDFVERIYYFGIKPHVYEHNNVLFNYILEKDVGSIIRFKEKTNVVDKTQKISNKDKIKSFIKKTSIKTRTYPLIKKFKP